MHEPPSEQLVRQLTDLQLCRPRDFHRARGRVRRLSHDLPAFDSVWIDSLVQLRLLTPYQARQLEAGNGNDLRIGSLVAIDEMGRSSHGATYLARKLDRRDRCVVRRQRIPVDRLDESRQHMARLLEQLNGFVHPQLVVPNEQLFTDDSELITVCRYVHGLPLNELLVRRGRFPATVVLEIGRQLFEGLAALHARSFVHGDIRLSNIRLTDNGLAVLVNGAVRPIVHPYVTIHDGLSLDCYDGLAPELIGTCSPATASSDMYAAGCVLSQLLTGRPPYISADPLTKIAAHQTRTIEDVRVWAPDTPPMLADSIRQLTSPSPNSRPRSFEEILQNWGRAGSLGRSRLRQFRRLFNGSVPHFSSQGRRTKGSGWGWMVAALIGVSAGAALLFDQGLRTELLSVGQNLNSLFHSSSESRQNSPDPTATSIVPPAGVAAGGMLPLPSPSAQGVILLKDHGPYEAGNIVFEGALTIQSAPDVSAEISVGRLPLSLSATEVKLEGITIRRAMDESLLATVNVRSQKLSLVNCEFLGFEVENASSSRVPTPSTQTSKSASAIAWKPPPANSSSGGAIFIQNSVFHGEGAALRLAQAPHSIRIENTLKTGSAGFVVLGPKTTLTELALDLDRVTLRKSGALLQLGCQVAKKPGAPSILIKSSNSVFDLNDPDSALVEVDSRTNRDNLDGMVEMTSLDSVVEPGTVLFAKQTEGRLVDLDADEQFQGLEAGEIKFVGSRIHRASDSKTASIQGPRTSGTAPPGIDPSVLGPRQKH